MFIDKNPQVKQSCGRNALSAMEDFVFDIIVAKKVHQHKNNTIKTSSLYYDWRYHKHWGINIRF